MGIIVKGREKEFWSGIILFVLVVLGILVFSSLASAQSFTIPQKQDVCDTLNLTFIECGQLWLYYDDYINGSLETIIYVENETIVYVNSTTGEPQNDSDKEFRERQAQRDHEYRLAQLDVEKAGKVEDQTYNQQELDLAISKALNDNKPSAAQQQLPPAYVPPTQSPQSDYFPWVLGAIGIAVVFFFYRKYAGNRGESSFVGSEQFYPPTPTPQSYYEPQYQQPVVQQPPPQRQQYQRLPTQQPSQQPQQATNKKEGVQNGQEEGHQDSF